MVLRTMNNSTRLSAPKTSTTDLLDTENVIIALSGVALGIFATVGFFLLCKRMHKKRETERFL